jgi:hypothetical protein
MADPKLINIGTEREPVLVSENAVSRDSDKQERYWRGVASGSTLPSTRPETDQEALDVLLKKE